MPLRSSAESVSVNYLLRRCVSRVLRVFTRGAARRAIAATRARTQDLEGAIADLERKLEVDAAAYTPEPRKSFIPSLGSIGETNSFETPPPLRPQHSGETLDEVSSHVDARRSRRSRDSADE